METHTGDSYVPARTRWTDEDIATLTELVKTMSSAKAAEKMGRTHSAVKKAMSRFEIKGVPQHLWYTLLTEEEREARGEKIRKAAPKKYTSRPEGARLRQRRTLVGLYLQVFEALGNKCAKCGDADPLHLEVDHVNTDGAEHRRSVSQGIPYVRELLRCAVEEPGRLQVLCANCHREKRRRLSGWV